MFEILERFKNIICVLDRIRERLFCNYKTINKTNCSDFLSDKSPVKIISWNVQSLFFYTTETRLKNVIKNILDFDADLICLQEVFEDNIKTEIIKGVNHIYPYYLLGNTVKKCKLGEDSGLLVLSKYNINYKGEKKIDNCVMPDNFCEKSILYFSIKDYNFITTHLQSGDYEISKNQIMDISYDSPFKEYILLGDLNNFEADKIMNVECNNTVKTWENVILDYILPINFKKELKVNVINIDITSVTDHLPIMAEIIE